MCLALKLTTLKLIKKKKRNKIYFSWRLSTFMHTKRVQNNILQKLISFNKLICTKM